MPSLPWEILHPPSDHAQLVFRAWYSPTVHRRRLSATRPEDRVLFQFRDGLLATHLTKTRACPVDNTLIVLLGRYRGVLWEEIDAAEREIESYDDEQDHG